MRHTTLLLGFAALFAGRAAYAQGLSLDPPKNLLEDAGQPTPSNGWRVTLYWENDGGPMKLWDKQDRHYTAGVGASLLWRAPWVDALAQNGPSFFGEFNRRETTGAMGLVGSLNIFTPQDIGSSGLNAPTAPGEVPIKDDHPYAGWTYLGFILQRAYRTDDRYTDYTGLPSLLDPSAYGHYESLEFDLGILGPSSLGQNAQEMIHHTFDYTRPQGWNFQIHDEPEFSFKYNRRWRSKEFLLNEGGLGFDVLPEAGLTAGSLQDEARLGFMARLGVLPDDFGPGELANPADFTRPGIYGVDDPGWDLYIFGRPYTRFVAHNALLQGDNWRHDDPVTQSPEPAVFCSQFGFGLRFIKYFDLTYAVTYQSPEFHDQHGWDSWASVQLSFTYRW